MYFARMFRMLFLLGLLIVLVGEVLRVYWIMPFPGSQVNDRVEAAYFLHNNLWWIRLGGLALITFALMRLWPAAGRWGRMALLFPMAVYAAVFYLFNFKFTADHMFLKMRDQRMSKASVTDSTANDLMLVVQVNSDARAYPIEYHRLSSPSTRLHRWRTGTGDVLHGVPHRPRLQSEGGWRGGNVPVGGHGPLQRDVRGQPHEKLVAPGDR